ncbi:MAG: hypothetical protein ACI9QQ_001334, partial [Myxococcota bacterium]
MSDDNSVLKLIKDARDAHEKSPGTWPAKRELASAVRELMDCIAATDAPEQ